MIVLPWNLLMLPSAMATTLTRPVSRILSEMQRRVESLSNFNTLTCHSIVFSKYLKDANLKTGLEAYASPLLSPLIPF